MREPVHHGFAGVVARWNWKSAITSAATRGLLFFIVNLHGGLPAASAALTTELSLRLLTSGFYGSLTQAFSGVEPRWAGTLAASIVLPLTSHTVELLVHWWRGTDQLLLSIGASVLFTVLSTAFHLHVMRRGLLIVGPGSHSLATDFRAMATLIHGGLRRHPRSRVPS